MSSNTFPPVIFAASLAELAGVHIAELMLGTRCYVLAEDDNFYLVENASLIPNGATIIQSVPGALVGKPGALWATLASGGGSGSITPPQKAAVLQADWYIDSLTGSDTNDGKTPATALATLTEWSYRIGLQTIEIQMTVHVLTDLFSDDTPMGPINVVDGASLTIRGTVTTVDSGTFTGVVVVNPATNTPWSATDASVNWAAQIAAGTRIRLTSGAGVGSFIWPAKDLGGGAVRLSYPMTADPLLGAFGQSQTAVADNDTFDVEQLTSLGTFSLSVEVGSAGLLNIIDCRITDGTWSSRNDGGQSCLYACQTGGGTGVHGSTYVNCGSTRESFHVGGAQIYIFGGLSMGQNFQGGGFVIMDMGAMCQDGSIAVFGTGQNIISNAQVYDWETNDPAQAGLQIWQGVVLEIFEFLVTGKLLYGTASPAASYGIRIQESSEVLYDTDTTGLTITGPLGQVAIGSNSTIRTYAELPYIEGHWLSTTVTKTATAALTNAAFSAQSFAIAHLDAARTQVTVLPETDLGANVGWVASIDAPGSLQIKTFTTAAGPIVVPQTVFNVGYVLDPGPVSAGMYLL